MNYNIKYKEVIETLPYPFAYLKLITDKSNAILDYIIVDMNEAYRQLLRCIGKDEETTNPIELIGKKFLDCEEKEYYASSMRKWFSVAHYYVKEDCLVVILQDVTESKLLKIEKKKLKENYEKLFNSVYDPMFLVDVVKDGQVRYHTFNKSHEKATGLITANCIGKSPKELFGERQGEHIASNYLKCILSKAPVIYEETLILNNKTKTWITSLSPVIENDKVVQIIGTSRDITEKMITQEKLEYVSYHDSLTGLYNRAYFDQKLKDLDRAQELPISVIIADINGLKLSNDVFGHTKGDELLRAVATILKVSCRTYDIIARWGGDEFTIILPSTSYQNAQLIYQRIKGKCEEAVPSPIKPSLALGLATKSHSDEPIDLILADAEEKMYKNKLKEGKKFRNDILASFQSRLEERNKHTIAYYLRMAELAQVIEKTLHLSEKEKEALDALITFHDIGTVAIPEPILQKSQELEEIEDKKLENHPEIGFRITQAIAETAFISELILTHHERWDGKGYPQGLKGEEIPRISRIFALMDAYETMTHDRTYQKSMSHQEALDEIKRYSGSRFDPKLTADFSHIIF